jgi:hypothetical protein
MSNASAGTGGLAMPFDCSPEEKRQRPYVRSMPRTPGLLSWPAFQEKHSRAYTIFADLDGARRRQVRYDLLSALAKTLTLRGSYALMPESEIIRLAFERADDALLFAQAVGAHKTAREDGWAGQWSFSLDEEKEAAI